MNWFEQEVIDDWEMAVRKATHCFSEVRHLVIKSLYSTNPEIRSAAIATLNEANDHTVHELIVALNDDSDPLVRDEVVEYIAEFPLLSDIPVLFEKLIAQENLFMASLALNKLFNNKGPIIDSDDSPDDINYQIAQWKEIIKTDGFPSI
jgi:hypothetical protein